MAAGALAFTALFASYARAEVDHNDTVRIWGPTSNDALLDLGDDGSGNPAAYMLYDSNSTALDLHVYNGSYEDPFFDLIGGASPYVTVGPDVMMYGRATIRQLYSGSTPGVWYEKMDGSDPQFAGVQAYGTTGATWALYQNSGWRYTFKADGTATKYGSTTWSVYSDARVKQNISDYQDGLSTIEQIHPVWFQYNGQYGTPDDGQYHVGVVAQQLEQVAPYMVNDVKQPAAPDDPASTPQPETLKTVNAGPLTYMLVNAVQELAAQNRQLRAELDSVERALPAQSRP